MNAAMSTEEVAELCQQILKADGDRAVVISYAKKAGWWKDPSSTNKEC